MHYPVSERIYSLFFVKGETKKIPISCSYTDDKSKSVKSFFINKIKRDYFKNNGDVAIGSEDLFLFANKTNKTFYFGKIHINAQENIEFHNSIIKDIEISDEFKSIFDSFVSSRT